MTPVTVDFTDSLQANQLVTPKDFTQRIILASPYDIHLMLGLPFWDQWISQKSSFTSLDRYGNACVATGVTWTKLPSGVYVPSFDGTDDQISVPGNSLFAANNFSFGGWYKPSNTAQATRTICQIDVGNYGIAINANQNGVGLITGWARSAAAWKTTGDSTTVTLVGTWYHMKITYDSVRFRLYVNGVEEISSALTTAITYQAAPIIQIGGGGGYLWGTLGEISLINQTQSAAEVLAEYLATKGITYEWDKS